MLHRLITRFATLLLVAGLLAAPAAADAKRHHKRHARHHLVKKSRAVMKSAGRIEQGALSEPSEPSHEEPAPSDDPPSHEEPGAGEPDPVEHPEEPDPTPPGDQPSSDAGVVVSYGEGVLNVELMTDGHVVGKVGAGTVFSCRSASTHETITEGCNASLLHAGLHVHEFTVNYGPEGAWFARIIIVLP
jgi:hypothetical protein